MRGICTLANDRVYDQLVALLNSIDVNAPGFPVCIYPYDDNIERIITEARRRENVQIYNHQASIDAWDGFVRAVWDAHPTAQAVWESAGSRGYHRVGTHRRFCAFDGPFDQFLYMDADTLLLDSPDLIFSRLDTQDFVVYDFQFKQPEHVYEMTAPGLKQVLPEAYLQTGIFCSGFYGSHQGLFPLEKRDCVLNALKSGDAAMLYPMAPDQTLLNYMVMRCGISFENLSLSLPCAKRTGNSITSLHFEQRGDALYDNGVRLLYLHYIGISSRLFAHLNEGENIAVPYRDLFLSYRYLHAPDQRPTFVGKARPYHQSPPLLKRALKKLGIA